MSWFKKAKVVIPEITKYYIPEDEIIGLLEAFDLLNKNKNKTSHYVLWKKIAIIFPDLDIKWGSWKLEIDENPLCPYIVELKGGVQI